eukprot:scaffold207249_cov22-Tisochrysis_lutea.AAC.3
MMPAMVAPVPCRFDRHKAHGVSEAASECQNGACETAGFAVLMARAVLWVVMAAEDEVARQKASCRTDPG